MLTHLAIKNFQSLKKVELELGALTVIVGSSSSGKSATVRALKALVSNIRGSDYVTRGEKKTVISVSLDEGDSVVLERGDGVGSYVVVPWGSSENSKYTKLSGSVPDDVSRLLKLNVDLSFSQQFDKPYLLTESGATVARSLGELTNVSKIFSAAKEGNRLRLNKSSTLKLRSSDLEGLVLKAQDFRTLHKDVSACEEAESILLVVESGVLATERLRELIENCEKAETVLSRSVVPELPLVDILSERYNRLDRFKQLWSALITATRSEEASSALVVKHADEEAALRESLNDLLVSAGSCPLCGSQV